MSCTSCRISTTRHSKKLFHRCLSSILYKNEKYPFEGVYLLKILENYLWRSWPVMKMQDANQQVYEKNSFTHRPSCILLSFSQNELRLPFAKGFWKSASTISFRKFKCKVVLLVICLFNYNSSKSTFFVLNMTFVKSF